MLNFLSCESFRQSKVGVYDIKDTLKCNAVGNAICMPEKISTKISND